MEEGKKGMDKIPANEVFGVTQATLRKFQKEKKGGDALLLYFAYQQQSKIQETNQSRSTDVFMIKRMGWGKSRFQTAKKILKKMGLIEIVPYRKKGLIEYWFVRVKYMMKIDNKHQIQPSGEEETNTYNKIKEKCLKEKKKKIQSFSEKTDSLSSFGLDINYIEKNFENKKTLDSILNMCFFIKDISNRLGIEPVYNKDTINATHIMWSNYQLNDLDEFIEKVKDNWIDYEYTTNYQDFIRQDYYLPIEIEEGLY